MSVLLAIVVFGLIGSVAVYGLMMASAEAERLGASKSKPTDSV